LIFITKGQWLTEEADAVVGVALWMVIWWVTEAVHISITALLPLAIIPLFGIMDIKQVAPNYANHIVYLFFGGFVLALALEKVNLHKRIALSIIKLTGTSPDRVVLGFMIATASISMWISNTATTVVMLPIAVSVIGLLINDADGFTRKDQNFALSVMLGIAFSANVGGIATIIGTPPNTVMIGFLESEYDIEIPFVNWMAMALPFSIVMIVAIYFALVKWIYPNHLSSIPNSKELIASELEKLGPISSREKRVLLVFGVAVFLWIFRTLIAQYITVITLSDAGISMLAACALFAVPYSFKNGEYILEWKDTERLPWGILVLFGGGLALAAALSDAGLVEMVGEAISGQTGVGILIVTSILIAVMLFMTEMIGNLALVVIFSPVIAGIALGLDTDLLHMLIPVTMASSCAFMLPMATPPNAIVFASGYIRVAQMVRVGFILNMIAIILLIVWTRFYIPLFF